MKNILVDYMPFEVSAQQIRESFEKSGKLIVSGILQRADSINQNKRKYPKKILMREAKKYADTFVRERRALGELDHPDCVSEGCKILTADGWKDFANISDQEEVLTLNIDNKNIEIKTINKKIVKEYNGDLIHIKGKNIDLKVTPNHRLLLYDRNNNYEFITADEIYNDRAKYSSHHIPKLGNWIGEDKEKIVIPKLSWREVSYGYCKKELYRRDKYYQKDLILDTKFYVSLLGIYLADGHCSNSIIVITQQKDNTKKLIEQLMLSAPDDLEWIHIKRGFKIYDARLAKEFSKLGTAYNKYIPSEIKQLSAKYLQELQYWFNVGDGRRIKKRGILQMRNSFSTSEKLISDLHECAIKAGGSGNRLIQVPMGDYMFGGHLIEANNKKPLHLLNYSTTKCVSLDDRMLGMERIPYSGKIYSISVPNENYYVMYNGKAHWTGNSSVVNLSNTSHNIVEMHWNGNDLVGTIEVLCDRPGAKGTPAGNILKSLFDNNIKLGISSRGVGSVKELYEEDEEGVVEVQDDFELVAFDFISNPSTQGAFMNRLHESKHLSSKQQIYSNIENTIMDIITTKI